MKPTLPLRFLLGSLLARTGSGITEETYCPYNELGTLPVGRRTVSVVDENRENRTLTVDVWYPAIDQNETLSEYLAILPSDKFIALDNPAPIRTNDSWPLLVFSHGWGSIRTQFIGLMEHLASWGFVVAACDHAGNSANDPPSANIPYGRRDRPLDVSLVIDHMLSPSMPDFDLDSGKIGVLGNSMGGATALQIRTGIAASEVPPDTRVKAILPMSPPVADYEEGLDLPEIDVSTMVMGGELDTVVPVDPNSILVFDETMGLPRYQVDLWNAGHNSFSDICSFFEALQEMFGSDETAYSLLGQGSIEDGMEVVEQAACDDIQETHEIILMYATSFFRAWLMEDDAAKQCLTEEYLEQAILPVSLRFKDTPNETTARTDSPRGAPSTPQIVSLEQPQDSSSRSTHLIMVYGMLLYTIIMLR